jgi:hypothetical protein
VIVFAAVFFAGRQKRVDPKVIAIFDEKMSLKNDQYQY